MAICHISVVLNTSFNNAKDLRDTNICRNDIFQVVWNKLRNEVCFLRQSFTNILRLIYENEKWKVYQLILFSFLGPLSNIYFLKKD